MKKSLKPNGKNIEIALELLELSLILKTAVKKAAKKKIMSVVDINMLAKKADMGIVKN